jgi:hypothetical protein
MASLKKCIEQKCRDCSYDPQQAGSWRSQVQECTVKSCALWEVRPITMELMLRNRKEKGAAGVDLDALIEGLDDDEDVTSAVAA